MPDDIREAGDGGGPFFSRVDAEVAAAPFRAQGLQTKIEESWIGLGLLVLYVEKPT